MTYRRRIALVLFSFAIWACLLRQPIPTSAQAASLVPLLPGNFYPNGQTHDELLDQLPKALRKRGPIQDTQIWSGAIHVTGDVLIKSGGTLIILPGTLILVAARSDDQHSGYSNPRDPFNGNDPPYEGKTRTSFGIDTGGSLIVLGTDTEPVIITSDADMPRNDDWGKIDVGPDAHVFITRALIEYVRQIGISTSDLVIQRSIVRNMMEAVVIGWYGPPFTAKNYLITPLLTQNYIYNTGRGSITVQIGAPTITHNILVPRLDLEPTGWEQGAIAEDFPSCAVINHNYLDAGQPRPYSGEGGGNTQYKATQPQGFTMQALCNLKFEYNTITGSPLGIIGYAGPYSVEHNNIIPVEPPVSMLSDLNFTEPTCLFIYDNSSWASGNKWLADLLHQVGGIPPLVSEFSAPNNYWGSDNPTQIVQCLKTGSGISTSINYQPFATSFIVDALPHWKDFDWQNLPAQEPCTLTAQGKTQLRTGPGMNYAQRGALSIGQHVNPIGRLVTSGGELWWQLEKSLWLRSGTVGATQNCSAIPTVKP